MASEEDRDVDSPTISELVERSLTFSGELSESTIAADQPRIQIVDHRDGTMTFQTLVDVTYIPPGCMSRHLHSQKWVDIPIVHEDGSTVGARVRLMKAKIS